MAHQARLRICLLSYRSNPHCGGQGVYLRNLSRALKDLGHHVEVVSGPPDPILDDDIPVHSLASLDLYNPDDLFRIPSLKELSNPVNMIEWLQVATLGFPEPFTFGLRAWAFLKNRLHQYDVIHDNQSLSYGLTWLNRSIPVVCTIHHPITRDLDIAVETVSAFWKKIKHLRWYSFIRMQKRVADSFSKLVTVSECSRDDICADFKIAQDRFEIVPNGIDINLFYPIKEIEREKNRIIVTNSADMPLKGLYHLLFAVAHMAKTTDIQLTVIGTPKKNGAVENLVRSLDIGHLITFTGRVDHEEFVRHYARASVAVIPSLYEGFGLPAGEAMACGVPVVSTTGGALPEVVGDAGILVPPGDHIALADGILKLLNNKELAKKLGEAGYRRVHKMFTWKAAAQKTVETYREAIRDHSRF
ncbi:glycosyltransferase family 4 protein [Desulfobacterales bacterium HSG16]|nr:glycosyltransferase family 4 protein [Desulfobacterales bacterium HSG16]